MALGGLGANTLTSSTRAGCARPRKHWPSGLRGPKPARPSCTRSAATVSYTHLRAHETRSNL
eukprot:7196925-Lingulodinium_polyedra.AAC.1